jgi:hypothetical protein
VRIPEEEEREEGEEEEREKEEGEGGGGGGEEEREGQALRRGERLKDMNSSLSAAGGSPFGPCWLEA